MRRASTMAAPIFDAVVSLSVTIMSPPQGLRQTKPSRAIISSASDGPQLPDG